MCVCLCVCTCVCSQRPKEGFGLSGARVTGLMISRVTQHSSQVWFCGLYCMATFNLLTMMIL